MGGSGVLYIYGTGFSVTYSNRPSKRLRYAGPGGGAGVKGINTSVTVHVIKLLRCAT